MTSRTLTRVLALGTVTGMRSMAGAATLAAQRGGFARGATAIMAIGEMIADKTPFVGNRTDAGPQTGRGLMGALVGALVAHQDGEPVWLGALVGAGTAVVATHLSYRCRTRVPLPVALAGLLEDAVVIGAGTLYARQTAAPGRTSNRFIHHAATGD
jgi:uncharacterized membrane protein